jgi:hypothetical protein
MEFLSIRSSSAASMPSDCVLQITSCGCAIRKPGEYHVIAALTESSKTEDCITIENVSVLYLDGHRITSTAPISDIQNSNAIRLSRRADRAVVVGGGAMITGFTNALLVEDLGANVSGFSATDNDEGLFVNFASDVTAYNFDVSGNASGIQILHSRRISLSNFTANDTTSDGIFMSGVSDSQLTAFQASSSPGSGIYMEEGGCNYVLTGCQDLNSQGNRIFGGTLLNNGFTGISLAYYTGLRAGTDRNQIIGNNLHGNFDGDLDEQNPNCAHNLWVGNTFDTSSENCVH